MPSRDIIRQLTGQTGSPQLLNRFSVAPSNNEALAVTPRRPLTEVLSDAAASPRDVVPADRGLAALPLRPPRSA